MTIQGLEVTEPFLSPRFPAKSGHGEEGARSEAVIQSGSRDGESRSCSRWVVKQIGHIPRQKAPRKEIWRDRTFISSTVAAKSLCNVYQGRAGRRIGSQCIKGGIQATAILISQARGGWTGAASQPRATELETVCEFNKSKLYLLS